MKAAVAARQERMRLMSPLFVGGDSHPGGQFEWEDWSGDVVESMKGDARVKEDQQRKLANALEAKRVGKPTGGNAATFLQERGCCRSDNPSEGFGASFCSVIRAQKEVIALKKVLTE